LQREADSSQLDPTSQNQAVPEEEDQHPVAIRRRETKIPARLLD